MFSCYNIDTPELIPELINIIRILNRVDYLDDSGNIQRRSLKRDGYVVETKSNEDKIISRGKFDLNTLGILSYDNRKIVSEIIFIQNCTDLFLSDNGYVYILSYKNDEPEFTPIPNLVNIIQIARGSNYWLALNMKGGVHLLRSPNYDQHFLISKLSNIIEISITHLHALALDDKGNVYSWGKNLDGQLGLGDNINREYPTLIPNFNIF